MHEMKTCSQCRKRAVKKSKVADCIKIAGHKFCSNDIAGFRCTNCGAEYLTHEGLNGFERRVAEYLVKAGEQSGEAIKFMRKVIGLKAIDFAKMLNVTPETISRWENKQRLIDRAALVVLQSLVRDALEGTNRTVQILTATATPARIPKTVQLGV